MAAPTAFDHTALLYALVDLSDEARRAVVSHLDDSACEAIYECVRNVFKNSHLDADTKRTLKQLLLPRKDQLQMLANNTQLTVHTRRVLLREVSDELAPIIAVALQMLAYLSQL